MSLHRCQRIRSGLSGGRGPRGLENTGGLWSVSRHKTKTHFLKLVLLFIVVYSGLQCEAGASYQPCMSSCPAKTCDNLGHHNKLSLACSEEPCVEGCAPPSCHRGFVFQSHHSRQCIHSLECRVKCRRENGTQFYEGDTMEERDCQSW